MPLTDHHELAGFENPHRVLQTWLGTEFRPQMYINLLNRLMLLEFTEAQPQSNRRLQVRHKVENSKELTSDATTQLDRKTQVGSSESDIFYTSEEQ
jgi:hypothetical protein